jgi:hypothetical protein
LGMQLPPDEIHPGIGLKRDAAYCAAVALEGEPNNETFRQVGAKLNHYYSSSWPREKGLPSCPSHRVDRIEGYFWVALNARDRLIGWEQIRNIVAASAEVKSAFLFPGPAANPSATVDSDLG